MVLFLLRLYAMPAWLSPRVRLGVTASLIVLIACALLLTPHLFHDDDPDAPGSLTTESASIDLPPASLPSSTLPVLPRLVTSPAIDNPAPGALPPLHSPSPATGADGTEGGSDSSADTAPDIVLDWLAQNPLADQGIALPSSDCVDCDSTPRQVARLSTANGPLFALGPGGGGGGGGGGSFASGLSAGTSGLVDTSTPTNQGSGPRDRGVSTPPVDGGSPGGPNPPGNPPGQPIGPTGPNGPKGPEGPGDPNDPENPDGPGPHDPPVAQVPEPSSLIVAGAGALSFMIRARLARKRRG